MPFRKRFRPVLPPLLRPFSQLPQPASGPSPKSKPCSPCRSWISSGALSRSIANISMPTRFQRSTLLSVKTGGCSEDCGYCSQSARNKTELEREKLLPVADVVAAAVKAKARRASAWGLPGAARRTRDLEPVLEMIREVKALGMQTCVTLGMLRTARPSSWRMPASTTTTTTWDTAAEFCANVITTHSQQDRIDTIGEVRKASINVCSGGIIGMGESRRNRAALIAQLANLSPAPESVPINNLVAIPGTPMAGVKGVDNFEFVAHHRGGPSRCRPRSCVSPPAARR